jgi:hypothetical protein
MEDVLQDINGSVLHRPAGFFQDGFGAAYKRCRK